MAKNGKTLFGILLILGIIGGGVIALGASGITGSTVSIELTPDTFDPVYVDSMKYTIRDVDGTWLDEISSASNLYHYHDSQGRYPDVDIMFSQPFPCYSDGTYLQYPSELDHPTSRSLYVDGKLYFLSDQYYFGVDICGRTYSNTANWQIAPEIILNPLRGIDVQYTPAYAQFHYTDPGSPQNPDGNLILAINTDCNLNNNFPLVTYDTCVTSHSSTVAKITTSLYPMEFQVSSFNPVPSSEHQLNAAIQYISNYWGTRPVIVQPEITIKGYNDYIHYSYDRDIILPNGTMATVKVETTSAKVGFVECYKSQIESKGAVPNYLDPYLKAKVNLKTDKQTEQKGGLTEPTTSETPANWLNQKLTGAVQYKGSIYDEVTTLGAEANIYGALVANGLEGKDIKIDLTTLDKFSLPTEIKPKAEFELQEISQLYIAATDVTYNTLFWNGGSCCFGVNVIDKIPEASGTTTIHYPYKLDVTNTFAISRIVFRVAIISENNPTVYVSGKPIDPSKISDFELTSYGLNPTIDDFVEEQPFGFDQTTIAIIVVCIIAAVAITVLVIIFRPKPATSSRTETKIGIFVNRHRRSRR